jgi:integrase
MIDDMRMRQLSPKTQHHYIHAIRQFTAFLGRSPDTADAEDLRRYQLHLVDQGLSSVSLNATITALKFFFAIALDRVEVMARMQTVYEPRTLPVIMSREEVARLLAAAANLKHQTALAVAYGAGLRASEVINLKVTDIDSQRMTLRIEQGKGRKDRYTNKTVLYGLLFDVAADTLRTIAADRKRLGAQIGVTLVLHTWGSALTHHPHVHGIVPGGGLSPDGQRWIACRPGFFLPVRVLSRLFRRRFLEALENTHRCGKLQFFSEHMALADADAFANWLAPLRKEEWVVYAKPPFAGPQAVLAYLSRYTHRVAISNSRLVAMDERGVTFRWKDYRARGRTRQKTMTLDVHEFMRRFLLHVLPYGFHRIRHYGIIANAGRKKNLAKARELLGVIVDSPALQAAEVTNITRPTFICRHCGVAMNVIDTFARGQPIRAPPNQRGAI